MVKNLPLKDSPPKLYEPFGFREIGEHVFIEPWMFEDGSAGFRELNLYDATDSQLTQRLLQAREPVFHMLGVVHETGLLGFNEGRRTWTSSFVLSSTAHA